MKAFSKGACGILTNTKVVRRLFHSSFIIELSSSSSLRVISIRLLKVLSTFFCSIISCLAILAKLEVFKSFIIQISKEKLNPIQT